MSPTTESPSPPPLDGELRVDDRARAAAAEDFGHVVHQTPEGVALPPDDLGPLGQVVVSPIVAASVGTPLLRLPSNRLCFTFNLIRLPATDDAVEARRLVTANRAVYERVRDAGGTLYPVSAFPMSVADWRTHFGATFDGLAVAKREHDPGHVLTPGYEVFSDPKVPG